jgi:HPt (histidine-containing phosphotransfer) domain-containing protein
MTDAIDFDYLLSVCGDDEELAQELVSDFLELFPGQLAEVRAAASAGDAVAVRSAAHRLKGSCLAVGANALGEILRQCEDAAREGNIAESPGLCDKADAAFESLVGDMTNRQAFAG